MRIELTFELERAELPKDNKSIWISFLKNVLTHCNEGKYFDKYFADQKEKDYAFSIIFSKPEFSKEKVLLKSNQVKMIFSSDDRHKTGLIFFAAFIQAKNKRFPLADGNAMTLKHIKQLGEHTITSSKAIFRTVTGGGLVVREHERETNRDRYYTFQDKGFSENLKRVLMIQAEEAGFPAEWAEHIIWTPIQCRKVVIKHYGIYLDATVGIFKMEADPELLQYFYQAGMGSKHSMGYGLLDLISPDKNQTGKWKEETDER